MPVGPIRLIGLPGLRSENLGATGARLREIGLSCALTHFRDGVFLRVSPHAYSTAHGAWETGLAAAEAALASLR